MPPAAEDRYWLSKVLHALDEFFASPTVAALASAAALAAVAYFIFGGSEHDLVVFAAVLEAVTLLLVFVVQHTQGREQAATQRKLDELIRALADADSNLIQLEEAPDEQMDEVAREQRRRPRKQE